MKDQPKKAPTLQKTKSSCRENSPNTSNEDSGEEDQTDLIEKLNALRDSCEKFSKKCSNSYETPKKHISSTGVSKDDKKCLSKARRSLINSPSSATKNKKGKRKSATKRKRSLSLVQNNFGEDDHEGNLVIAEPKIRKKTKSSAAHDVNDDPSELMEIISKSGIDDILEEKARKTQLTAAHVKKIIRDAITDEGVLSILRNLLGVEENPSNVQPILTRARTKELISLELLENGELSTSPAIPPSDVNFIPGVSLPVSETQSLVTEDFPDEEEDEEYRPEADEQALSDGERSQSNFSTPCSVATPRSSVSTPRNVGTSFCSSSFNELTGVLNKAAPTPAHRTLDFANPTSLICSRTRSKFSMTDTPLEELESAFKPPDITPDMYETECYDDVWKEFLMDFAQPQGKHDAAATEDDYVVDPEYNLMADAEKHVEKNINDLKEELREDRAVRVTKREYSDLMSELLDSFPYASDEDDPQFESARGEVYQFVDYSQNPMQDSVYTVPDETEMTNQQCIANYQQQITEPIKVKILIPEFPSQFLEILKNQWLQHVQLITSVAVLCNHRPYFESVADGCRNMLNEMHEASPRLGSLYHPWNLQPAFDTLMAHNKNKPEDDLVMPATVDPLSYDRFPADVKEVFLHSSALPFKQLLPKVLFSKELQPKKRKFQHSEDLLLAMRLQDVFSVESNRKLVINHCKGLYRTIIEEVHKEPNVHYSTAGIREHILHLRKKKWAINPISKLFRNLHRRDLTVEVPPLTLMEMLPGMPCQLKDVSFKYLTRPWRAIVWKVWKQQPDPSKCADEDLKMGNCIVIVQSMTEGTKIILPPVEMPPASAKTKSFEFRPILPRRANPSNTGGSAFTEQVKQPASSNNTSNPGRGNIVFLPSDPCMTTADVTDTHAIPQSHVNDFVKAKGCGKNNLGIKSSSEETDKELKEEDPLLLSTPIEDVLEQDLLLIPSEMAAPVVSTAPCEERIMIRKAMGNETTETVIEEDPLLLSEISPGDAIPDEYLNPVTPCNQLTVDMPFFRNTPVCVSQSDASFYSVRSLPDAIYALPQSRVNGFAINKCCSVESDMEQDTADEVLEQDPLLLQKGSYYQAEMRENKNFIMSGDNSLPHAVTETPGSAEGCFKEEICKSSFSESLEEPDETAGNFMELAEIRHSPVKELASPVKKVDSPEKKLGSPVRKIDSPVKIVDSPVKKVDSPVKKIDSPLKKVDSLVKKIDSPEKKLNEPRERLQKYLKKPARTKKFNLIPKVYSKSKNKINKFRNANKSSQTNRPCSWSSPGPGPGPGPTWSRDDDLIFVQTLNEKSPSELVKELWTFFPHRTEEEVEQRLRTIATFILETFS